MKRSKYLCFDCMQNRSLKATDYCRQWSVLRIYAP